jgi:hypothetical protein
MIIVLRTFKIYSRVQKNHHHCEHGFLMSRWFTLVDIETLVRRGSTVSYSSPCRSTGMIPPWWEVWHQISINTQPAQYSEQGIRLTRNSRKRSPPLGRIETANHKVIIYSYPLTYINMSSCQYHGSKCGQFRHMLPSQFYIDMIY